MSLFKDDVAMGSSVGASLVEKRVRKSGAPIIKPAEANVRIRLIDKDGRVEEEREGHNIFLNYGREWLSQLIGLDTGYSTFRNDRIRYMAFGIGGTSQDVTAADINAAHPGSFPLWGNYVTPAQTDTDATVTGLEWPVPISETALDTYDFYDDVSAPATFPSIGTIRFTSVLGHDEVNFSGLIGSFPSVPLSEVGLFTESVPAQTTPPWPATYTQNGSSAGERYMVAYHTFDTLNKTTSFVLQTDWEIRIS